MKKILTLSTLKIAILSLVLFATGCQVNVYDDDPGPPPCGGGPYGLDGQAFIALDYSSVEPSYIWGNNGRIPSHFAYGQYYLSNPGTYDLYYEGSFLDGCCVVDYYWDISYDLWYHPGTAGGPCGQPGMDGADSFLTIFMDPDGPGISRINKKADENFQILERTEETVVTQEKRGEFTLKVTYTKLKASKKDQLDPKNIKEAIIK